MVCSVLGDSYYFMLYIKESTLFLGWKERLINRSRSTCASVWLSWHDTRLVWKRHDYFKVSFFAVGLFLPFNDLFFLKSWLVCCRRILDNRPITDWLLCSKVLLLVRFEISAPGSLSLVSCMWLPSRSWLELLWRTWFMCGSWKELLIWELLPLGCKGKRRSTEADNFYTSCWSDRSLAFSI